jgi:hypothetical protein
MSKDLNTLLNCFAGNYDSDKYYTDRKYNVNIVAQDEYNITIKFVETVSYEGQNRGPVPEFEREEKAINQVRNRMPHLRNIQAKGSCHV